MDLLFILIIPVILAVVLPIIKDIKKAGIVNSAGYGLVLVFAFRFIFVLMKGNYSFSNFFYADILSGYFVLLVAIVSFASALYSISYISDDLTEGTISNKESKLYYILFNLFVFTMLFTAVVNNLGIVWVAIEMTTLTSAFLVGFYNKEKSIEAAWKYIIICSVGISFALLGTILFYYTVSVHGGVRSLNWTDMVSVASKLDPKVLKIAFIFILVGYGTKAGIAPMHTWLPDAHSQALTPVSALLSGVLLKMSLYVMLRFMIIINKSIGAGFSQNLFIFFGILSLLVSVGFILVQKDIKRLLAYSSIEHIGIILVGLGIGGRTGLYAALLHMLNHAVTKALMFFGAGNIARKYKTHNMQSISGVIQSMPFTGVMLIIGVFAIAGSPPFSIFLSELMILISGFVKGSYLTCGVFLLVVAAIFGAIVYHFSKMIFGKKPENIVVIKEPLSGKLAFLFLIVFIITLGIYIPGLLDRILNSSVGIMQGF